MIVHDSPLRKALTLNQYWSTAAAQDLKQKGVEVNFRRALLEQCQERSSHMVPVHQWKVWDARPTS